jgi:hypothetical protein
MLVIRMPKSERNMSLIPGACHPKPRGHEYTDLRKANIDALHQTLCSRASPQEGSGSVGQ